jgi:aerobic-type carbon monoxide dehydrogenase small subunit (CoxS/CutS family)
MATYNLRINGNAQTVDTTDADKPLLYVLRELGLTAAKFGCGLASAAPARSSTALQPGLA